ncbi:MAG: DUF805 domain-containing protein [Alphaproteobacteria bacterium]|nr:DUF805 domain-containing protein [Alphaproteobacteria bacterium]
MTLTQKLFGIKGRLRRSQYWGYSIATGVVFFLLAWLILGIQGMRGVSLDNPDDVTIALFLILLVPFAWMGICISAKRCHDRDRSGWFQMIPMIPAIALFIPIIGVYIEAIGQSICWIWLFIELGCLDGTQGENRFGPSPKGITSAQVANVFR